MTEDYPQIRDELKGHIEEVETNRESMHAEEIAASQERIAAMLIKAGLRIDGLKWSEDKALLDDFVITDKHICFEVSLHCQKCGKLFARPVWHHFEFINRCAEIVRLLRDHEFACEATILPTKKSNYELAEYLLNASVLGNDAQVNRDNTQTALVHAFLALCDAIKEQGKS